MFHFLPSATELIYELGVQERLFGVTHECNYPNDAIKQTKSDRKCISSRKNVKSRKLMTKFVAFQRKVNDIYKLIKDNLTNARPDLIISQEICEVCSAYTTSSKDCNRHSRDKTRSLFYEFSQHTRNISNA